ncbi:hypothetical protein BH09ACT6_BH09ACT6_07390 [soil metagenome]
MSPRVGELDEEALAAALGEHPSATLAMLADMMTATDENLRRAVNRIAARLVLDRAQKRRPTMRGVRRLRPVSAARGGELDIDASMEHVVSAVAGRRMVVLEDLVALDWGRSALALVLVVDRSGSMNGPRLATAAVAAAACATRAPDEHAVIAFAGDVDVIRPLTSEKSPTATVDSVLRLKGHGETRLCAALRAAQAQLAGARAERRVIILLSDCRATDGDAAAIAGSLTELIVLAPADDSEQAQALAASAGARFAPLGAVDTIPALLEHLLS